MSYGKTLSSALAGLGNLASETTYLLSRLLLLDCHPLMSRDNETFNYSKDTTPVNLQIILLSKYLAKLTQLFKQWQLQGDFEMAKAVSY